MIEIYVIIIFFELHYFGRDSLKVLSHLSCLIRTFILFSLIGNYRRIQFKTPSLFGKLPPDHGADQNAGLWADEKRWCGSRSN